MPRPMPSDFWVLEDTALDGKLYRTPGLLALLPTLSYSVITPPANGEVEIRAEAPKPPTPPRARTPPGTRFSGTRRTPTFPGTTRSCSG